MVVLGGYRQYVSAKNAESVNELTEYLQVKGKVGLHVALGVQLEWKTASRWVGCVVGCGDRWHKGVDTVAMAKHQGSPSGR